MYTPKKITTLDIVLAYVQAILATLGMAFALYLLYKFSK